MAIVWNSEALRAFLVSRRALNWVIRRRWKTYFLNEALFTAGYATKAINIGSDFAELQRRTRADESQELRGVRSLA